MSNNIKSIGNRKLEDQTLRGDGRNSFEFGETTQVLSEYGSAFGKNTIAGIKGYFFQNIEFGPQTTNATGSKAYGPTIITLTKEQPDDITLAPLPEPFDIGFAIGDILSFTNDSKYIDCSKITAINKNTITVDSVPFNSIKNMGGDVGVDDYQVICVKKPLAGASPLGLYANAEGEECQSLERATHAEGRKTKATGQYSHAEGRETVAGGYISHSEGQKTNALGSCSHSEGKSTNAKGSQSHAEGQTTTASGENSHAEGYKTVASGKNSHAEGNISNSDAEGSHTEGYYNIISAGANYAHAENYGNKVTANAQNSHAEGINNEINAEGAHVEGAYNIASGEYQHVQGKYNVEDTAGRYADIIGGGTGNGFLRKNIQTTDWYGNTWFANKLYLGGISQDEPKTIIAPGERMYSVILGENSQANGISSFAAGVNTVAGINGYLISEISSQNKTITLETPCEYVNGDIITIFNGERYHNCSEIQTVSDDKLILTVDKIPFESLIDGYTHAIIAISRPSVKGDFAIGNYSFATGTGTAAIGIASSASGENSIAIGNGSHAEGSRSVATSGAAHAEGVETTASGGEGSHSEGKWTKAVGAASHAEGKYSEAHGEGSHSEGFQGISYGKGSHTEGYYGRARGEYSHVEGYRNEVTVDGNYGHAEGYDTTVKATAAHAEGLNTVASSAYQHVQGKYNAEDTENKYADIIGGGTSDKSKDRKNIQTTDWNGNFWISGDMYVGGTSQDDANAEKVATEKYVSETAGEKDENGNLIHANGVGLFADHAHTGWNTNWIEDESNENGGYFESFTITGPFSPIVKIGEFDCALTAGGVDPSEPIAVLELMDSELNESYGHVYEQTYLIGSQSEYDNGYVPFSADIYDVEIVPGPNITKEQYDLFTKLQFVYIGDGRLKPLNPTWTDADLEQDENIIQDTFEQIKNLRCIVTSTKLGGSMK